jgi:signal transduction histidine kinase
VRVNQTFLDWTGLQREAVLGGQQFVALLTVGSRIFFETRCTPLLLAGRQVEQVSLDLRAADGSAVPVLFSAKVHATGPDGVPELLRLTLVDLSERRRFEQQLVDRNAELAEANDRYDTFAHAIAHDLRAPLRAIRLNTEFFLEDVEGTLAPPAVEQLQSVMRLADRMHDMLNDLLLYAQVTREHWEARELSLATLVAETVELLGPAAADAQLQTQEAIVVADPRMLQQVLLNLIANALKYSGDTPADVEIDTCSLAEAARSTVVPATIASFAPETRVVRVTDRGIGIDRQYHERIFDLFQQVDRAAEGSGAGLALCRAMCRRFGGDVWVASELGHGTTFFVLPGR